MDGFRGRSYGFACCLVGLAGLLASVLLLGAVVLFEGAVYVQEGTVAVVTQDGRAQAVLYPGLNFKLPFVQNVVVYSTQEIIYETREEIMFDTREGGSYLDAEVDTVTSDGQQISVAFTVRFRIDASRAGDILENFASERDIVNKVVKANARVRVRNVLRRFSADDLSGERVTEAERMLDEQLRMDYQSEGIELVFFGLRNIGFIQD